MGNNLFDVPARARNTDPATSHEAAAAVQPATDTIRAAVERFAYNKGEAGFIDEELSAAFDAADSSSYRTRRGELTQVGTIVDSRRRRKNDNMRDCIVWVHRSYVGVCPPPERPLTLREQLGRHANRLDLSANGMQAEGRTAFAAELRETAALIRTAITAPPATEKTTGHP